MTDPDEKRLVPMKPSVLFVCVKNGGKSQLAAGLMRLEAGDGISVSSAGTKPGTAINALSAEVLADLGVDISAEQPTLLTEEDMRAAGLVVVLGGEAKVPAVQGVEVEIWETDEPSLRGIEGRDRMVLVRDDIHARVKGLRERLLSPS
ncbi:arsenate-mycothiol transferase ArsC [Arthrobacter sp. CAL618]|uniref:arsenate-mycothiol transferase ArsC n=1 Tax=Arthrobacter sp. CAL618 TaxID=1055770 RepID=UPI000428C29F